MTTASKRKGDWLENAAIESLGRRLGRHLTKPRAGAAKDKGDIAGVPGFTIEAKNLKTMVEAISAGLRDLDVEQRNTGTRWGCVVVKRPRSQDPDKQLVVMEMGQFADLLSELPENKLVRTRCDL